jgi:hypothetical protein
MNRAPGWNGVLPSPRLRKVAILAVATVVLGGANAGCSFVFSEGPPSDHEKLAYFDCTSTYGLSVADGLIGLSSGIGAGTTLSQSKQDYADKNNGASRNAVAFVDIATAGVLAASAVYGAVQAARCDRAKEELRARILAPPRRLSPPASAAPVPPPPPPPEPSVIPAPGPSPPAADAPGSPPAIQATPAPASPTP